MKANPIHLWDACTGSLRATYRAYNAVDEITAALCVSFTDNGSQILAGYNKIIRIFDTAVPGRDYDTIPTYKKGQDGQAGEGNAEHDNYLYVLKKKLEQSSSIDSHVYAYVLHIDL